VEGKCHHKKNQKPPLITLLYYFSKISSPEPTQANSLPFCSLSMNTKHMLAAIAILAQSKVSSASSYFQLISGSCQVTDNCVYSTNYPSDYNNDDFCEFELLLSTTLSVSSFSLESCCDSVQVGLYPDLTAYTGTSGPDGVYVSAGYSIYFNTDSSVTDSGFEICASSGYCVSSLSTVKVLLEGQDEPVDTPLNQVKVGERVLAMSKEGEHVYTPVRGLPHSEETVEPFIQVQMAPTASTTADVSGLQHNLLVTNMHTFPMCDGKMVRARDLKQGDCLFTVEGQNKVQRTRFTAEHNDQATYTIVVDEDIESVAVGGVFTHARSAHPHQVINKDMKKKEQGGDENAAATHMATSKSARRFQKTFLRSS
jgi:hypothetical protein